MIPQKKSNTNSSTRKIIMKWKSLPKDLIQEIINVAQEVGLNSIAIVGGVVRDELLNNSQNEIVIRSKDLDLVVEGSASDLADALYNQLGAKRVTSLQIYNDYNTAEMKIDGFPVDLATARIEQYPQPGQNPNVTPSSLKEDLSRRDFTINAMAIDLSDMSLIDPHEGQHSLLKKEIKFLHNQSVKEDPTRIIRAARYSSRFLFNLSPESLAQIRSTLKAWPWNCSKAKSLKSIPAALSTRLRLELEILLKQEDWGIAIEKLQDWGALILLDQSLQDDKTWKRRLKWASKFKINLLTALISSSQDSQIIAARLQLPIQQQNLILQTIEIKKFLLGISLKTEYLDWPPSKWVEEIEQANWNTQAIEIAICNAYPMWRKLLKWLHKWRLVKSPISAKELIEKGWEPGPALGQELRKLRARALDDYK